MVTHSVTMLEKHLVYAGETPPRNFTTNRVKKRSIKPEDPMSHRIIEKRRRDRMNNCLADLSRLIPPEYLKKGRGRIEKTEIIEMAIKHMRHLQNIIASTRFTENSDSSMPSPPTTSTVLREAPASASEQPIIIEHYRLGYLECLSEAMHFLVEVQGYFAGDSLCVQMVNHLHKHCDKILKGSGLNFPKKHNGETTSSDSSTSPINGAFNNSPPLGMSNSTCSASDDNQPGQNFDGGRQFDDVSKPFQGGYRSPKTYSDACYPTNPKRNPDGCCSRYVDSEGAENENRSDSELTQNFVLKCKNHDVRKDEPKSYLNNFDNSSSIVPRTVSVANGISTNLEDSNTYENVSLKEENVIGPSQLREMLTSPSSMCAQLNGHCSRNAMEGRGDTSPMSNASGCETSSGSHLGVKSLSSCLTKNLNFKIQSLTGDSNEGNSNFSEGLASDNHHMMYKFKNNIKQRFSKEKRENSECDVAGDQPAKKQRACEDHQKYSDSLMKERLNLLDRTDVEEEKVFKFNADFEVKKRNRYGSESETQDGGDLSNRLSFGHKSMDKAKRSEEPVSGFPHSQKMWTLSPNASVAFCQGSIGCKVSARPITEYSSAMSNSFNNLSISTADLSPGIPIFALHAKGSFYIPLTLDHATLAPFLTLLGITKTDEAVEEKTVLHPVTISVNFQSHLVR